MQSGYFMIDCKKMDLTKGETPQTINGMYATIHKAMEMGKPIYAYNCIWGSGKSISPIQCFTVDFGSYVIVTASTLQIIISNEDVITINNLVGD